MSNKATLYTHQCLAGAGFAIINSQIAWRIRPDLFASGQDCALSFHKRVEAEGVRKFTAKIKGIGDALVLARSDRNLAERIEDVTGYTVDSLSPYEAPAVPEPVRGCSTVDHERAQRLSRLRDLAAQDLQTHDCQNNRDILAARAELAHLI